MSDGEHSEQVPESSEEQTGGLRRAMEQRVKSLHEAEERIRREQSALQEQAKVVFAERELAKREAALAVSEGIAAGVPAERDKDLEEREHALAAREEALEQLQSELDSRSAAPSEGDLRRVAELEQTVNELEERLAAAAQAPDGAGEERSLQSR